MISPGELEDNDICEIIFHEETAVQKEADSQVTPELATEGLEIIKEVPARQVLKRKAKNEIDKEVQETGRSKYLDDSQFESPNHSESSDPEWCDSLPDIKQKNVRQNKKSTKSQRVPKKSKAAKSTSSPRKPKASPVAKKTKCRKKSDANQNVNKSKSPERTQNILNMATYEEASDIPEQDVVPNKTTSEILVPSRAVGVVIGKKGAMVKRIQKDSGAYVYFLNPKDESVEHKVCIVTGTLAQVQAASSFINDLISGLLGTEFHRNDIKNELKRNSCSSLDLVKEEPPAKKPKLNSQGSPSNEKINASSKKKRTQASKVKKTDNPETNPKQVKKETEDIFVIECSEPAPESSTKHTNNKSSSPESSTKHMNNKSSSPESSTKHMNNKTSPPKPSSDNFKVDNSLRLWKDEDVVADTAEINANIARNIINLFNQECTIPFIARYRKELTGDMSAEKLREVQECYDNVKAVRRRVDNNLKTLAKENKLDEKVKFALMNAKTMAEVEILYAPFKPGNKKSLAERARSLGLEDAAMRLLNGMSSLSYLDIGNLVKPDVKGISNSDEVLKGIQHIIADIMAKDQQVLDFTKQKCKEYDALLSCHKSPTAEKEDKRAHVEGKETNNFKFENYFNFNNSVKFIKAHQVLAINRGESQKKLSVKILIPKQVKHRTVDMCWYKFCAGKVNDSETQKFLRDCIADSYNRLIEPHMIRNIRSELNKKADKESVSVFCDNLKQLLLTPPVRGQIVLGIDPGFKHGCKLAVISGSGGLILTDVIYPHSLKHVGNGDSEKLKRYISTYNINIIAIGNGTACRETETWISQMIKTQAFGPIEVKFCIVSEIGASIYSVSKQAEIDLPGIDPNCRSAVAIARRLQDPLLEYVKVEPKHLGVGMYQHDVPESMLKSALDSVVVECVSFVGVDLNICPDVLLRKVAGLNASRVQNIIEWRESNGPFRNRQQLLEVKGLGPKSFEQCAGFVKILPHTSIDKRIVLDLIAEPSTSKKKKTKSIAPATENPLDMTVIHPESYDLAKMFLAELGASPRDIGKETLIEKVNVYLRSKGAKHMADKLNVPEQRIQLITDALKQPLDYDIRDELEKPLFRSGVTTLDDLIIHSNLTGCVRNVTHFGAFVDIGVGRDGLIHISEMKKQKLSLGDRVKVEVIAVDIKKKRISLRLCEKHL